MANLNVSGVFHVQPQRVTISKKATRIALARWLRAQARPDVVHTSPILLDRSTAREIADLLDPPPPRRDAYEVSLGFPAIPLR